MRFWNNLRAAPRIFGPLNIVAPASGRAPKQLVVFLHGVDGRGDSWQWLADVWQDHLPDAVIAFPDGHMPSRVVAGTFRWWDLRSLDRSHLAAGARTASPKIELLVTRLQTLFGIPNDKTVLAGFSQGAMAALQLGERMRPPLAGVLSFCGMTVGLPARRRRARSRPPLFLYHGTHDGIVPFGELARSKALLTDLGFSLTGFAAEGVDHTIDLEGANLAGAMMRRWLVAP